MVQSTGSSSAMSAVNSACEPLSNDMATGICSKVECVIVDDLPDGCGAMLRYKHATAQCFADYENILYDEHSSCVTLTDPVAPDAYLRVHGSRLIVWGPEHETPSLEP